ncbi:alpha/beta hydrolase [Actinophytocola xinjiangensis]|uniref:alpha/beta hydrolase n=1 Tax=Actinophytocola xinjiangensis TaxID=485602 RepID=UPI001FE91DEB|nr:alpha/beta hydrolase [Actinophytocola xinjiangensis]
MDGGFAYRAIDPWAGMFAGALADRHTVYTYERRGRGESGNTEPYAKEREIEDLAAIIAEAGGSAAVLGLSSGGVLCLDAAAAGLPITHLAVYEAPVIVDDSHAPRPDDYLAQAKQILAEGRSGDAVAYAMTTTFFMPEEDVAAMRAEPWFGAMEAVAHTVAYDGEIMDGLMSGKPLPEDRWNSSTVKTLVIYGGASEQWVHNGAKSLADVLPVSHGTECLDGQNHDVDANLLAETVAKFIAS